ncbi:MAG: hypothetical protein PHQ74_07640 [Crocinitomicaceae bacterium]|nr:hypothetical protein [Crocinitomicaceae bacterium]
MRKSAILLLLLVLSTKISAQLQIKFSDVSKDFKVLYNYYPVSKNEFYTVKGVTSPTIHDQIVKYKNFQKVSSNKIKVNYFGGKNRVRYTVLNDQLVGFYKDESSLRTIKSEYLTIDKYDKDCIPEGSAKELLRIEIQKEWKNEGRSYSILTSADKSFFCVEYKIPVKKEEDKRQFTYKILSKDLEVISQGTYEVPYAGDECELNDRYLSNTGDYFISYNVYQYESKKRVKNWNNFQKVVLMQIKNNGVVERAIEFGEQRAMEMTYSSDADGIMTISGVYGLKSEIVSKGIFFLKYDFKNNTVIQSEYATFAEKGLDVSARKYQFNFKDMITLADGSLLGSIELYDSELKTTGSGENASTSIYYYYDDIITYKINAKGSFDWFNQMHKMHISRNDDGSVSSAFTFLKNDKLIVMFNDHVENYDDRGNYTTAKNYVKFYKKTNVVAYTEIDLETGISSRKLALSPEIQDQYAVPKMFQYDTKTNQVWMVFQPDRKNFQFAILEL